MQPVVRTMTQIPDISCVSFFVGDSPLVDSKNNVVGLMTAGESFVENPGEQINAIQTTTLTTAILLTGMEMPW